MANRRKLGSYPKRKDNARVSLLANPSPPASPSPFPQDPNVSSLYPGTAVVGNNSNTTASSSTSFDNSMATAVRQDRQEHQQPNASFDLSASSSPSTKHTTRFAPQHGNIHAMDQELPPEAGALQFMPAFEGSWDAEEKKEDQQQQQQQQRANSNRTARQQQQQQQQHKQQQQHGSSVANTAHATIAKKSSADDSVSNTGSSVRARGANRIQRLASLFSSRAVVRGDKQASSSPLSKNRKTALQNNNTAPAATITTRRNTPASANNNGNGSASASASASSPASSMPPSPAHSGASSAYVGWPGTQDKLGATVAMPGSYDEGSLASLRPNTAATAGAAATVAAAASANHHNNNNVSYERELQQAAAKEMNRWTGNSRNGNNFSGSSAGSLTPSPISTTPLERRIIGNGGSGGSSGNKNSHHSHYSSPLQENENAADYHLRATLADAKIAASSPLAARRSISAARYASSTAADSNNERERDALNISNISGTSSVAASEAVSFHDLFPTQGNNRSGPHDLWGEDEQEESSSRVNSSPSGSRTSSAYMNVKDMGYPVVTEYKNNNDFPPRSAGIGSVLPNRSTPQPPTKDALATNDRLQPPHRSFNAPGYRGLINKTKDVPSLMDQMENESMASSVVASRRDASGSDQDHSGGDNDSDIFDGLSVSNSDVFDNLSNVDGGGGRSGASPRKQPQRSYPERIVEETESSGGHEDFKMVLLGGGLTAIQTSRTDFSQRQTADDFDDNLTDSDYDHLGFARIPGINEMVSAGRSHNNSLEGIHGNLGIRSSPDPYNRSGRHVEHSDSPTDSPADSGSASGSGSSLFSDPYGQSRGDAPYEMDEDLSEYYIHPSSMKKLVRKYRRMSDLIDTDLSFAEFERDEDEHKSFAMFEMRSRIMENDIERGLERRGGTCVVDDLVTTPYNRTAMRIRDAVIVSKAWRDGASPADVINTALLTRRVDHAHFIKRPIHASVNDSASTASGYSRSSQRYYWEAVKWVDDTDFMQYRCPSLGPRHMRGSEMFTIGDCQSILLKLTNERCMELRIELNAATARQIIAEELMKEDGDASDEMMTESEVAYLTAMEEVKGISKQLVIAEQAFTLVRDRVEKLVARYEALLVKFDTESYAASSIVTCDSSYYSENDSAYWEAEDERERAVWARRAQRAELKAELAAREALLAKQEARMVKEEKQRELDDLRQKLVELQSEASLAIHEKDHSGILTRSFAMRRNDVVSPDSSGRISSGKVDSVKQRFRDRMAAKKEAIASPTIMDNPYGARSQPSPRFITPSPPNRSALLRSAGEEMFQHLDFYERSLKAVDSSHYSR